MFKGAMPDEPVMDVDAENVGIMSGFKDILMDDEEMDEDEMEMSQIMGRTPDSPEILMNNLRGDMRSVDARRDELADLVGYQAATETPEPVLAMLQPVLAAQGGISALPQPGAMPPGPPPGMMPPPPGGMPPPGMMPPDMGMPPPGAMPPGSPPEAAGGIGGLPVGMAEGGEVSSNFSLRPSIFARLRSGEIPAPEEAATSSPNFNLAGSGRKLLQRIVAPEPEPEVVAETSTGGFRISAPFLREKRREEEKKAAELQARLAMRGEDYIRANPELFLGSIPATYNIDYRAYDPLVPTPPLNMAKGGMVQYFSDGSDGPDEKQDGGVSRSNDTSSVLAGLSPDIQAQAQRAFLNSLQTPAALPDRAVLAKTLADEYRTLLGSDKKSAQAQLLLELGQRAFGYAANVDAEGRPLKGNALARLSGAVRTLPATIGKYTAEMDKEDRALKLMGLQAAEKRYETAQEARLKQQKTLADLYGEKIKAEGRAKGQGVKGTPFNQYQELITPFVEGTLDQPGQIRLINTVTEMVQPTTVTITDKFGNVSTEVRRSDIPRTFYEGLVRNFGQEAADNWVGTLGEDIKISQIAYPTAVGQGSAPTSGATPNVPPRQGTAPSVTGVGGEPVTTEGAQQVLKAYTLPGSDPSRPGLWEVRGYLAGPINTAQAFLSRNVPGMPPDVVDKVRKDAIKANEGLIEALATNEGRVSNDEMNRLRPIIGLTPRVFGGEGAMSTALVSLDDALAKEKANHVATMNAKDVLASAQSQARVKANLIDAYRSSLKVPPSVFTAKDLTSIPVGQEFVDKRDPNQFDIRRKDTFSFRSVEAIKNFQQQNPGKPYAVMLPSGKIQLYTAPGKAK